MKRVVKMMVFSTGIVAAFDDKGNQIPELQERSIVELWGEYAAASGFSVDDCECLINTFKIKLSGLGVGDISSELVP